MSSSTSFILLFKTDDEDEIFDIIKNYEDNFDEAFSEYSHVSGEDLVEELASYIYNYDIENIELLMEIANSNMENLKDAPKFDAINEMYLQLVNVISQFKEAENKGFKYYCAITFNDESASYQSEIENIACIESDKLSLKRDDLFIVVDHY